MTTGTLFTEDFLQRGLAESPVWQSVPEADIIAFWQALQRSLDAVNDPHALNEAQTEERVIRPMLTALGWGGTFSVQEKMTGRMQRDVPDYFLFPDSAAFALADAAKGKDAKLRHAIAVGDAKAWSIALDGQGTGAAKDETAAGQILRYLLDAEKINRGVQWAVLTSGRIWRLYYAGGRAPLDDYFEADLADILARPGAQPQLRLAGAIAEADEARRARLLKTFFLAFRRPAFLPDAALQGRTFHAFALDEGRKWETNVRADLSRTVFNDVFPGLIRALAMADKAAPKPLTPVYLASVREAALTALYRLLFALYAEDRDLLPSRDRKYDDYSLSHIRDDIARRLDSEDKLSARATPYWDHAAGLFRIIDEGDESIGVPPYNGGLFAKTRAPLLDTAKLSDSAFAPLLDKLSRTLKNGRLVRINYRDLSVRELGAIYERLLEYEPVANATAEAGIEVRLNAFGRKNTGSYYTPDELVTLIIGRTIGPLIEERLVAFKEKLTALKSDRQEITVRLAELQKLDPAERILDLKVCDPAMGSGHFLVSLIDHLALQAFVNLRPECLTGTWAQGVYASPLAERLAAIRARIEAEADQHKWTIRPEQLTDQNLIKRMVLKRCVYGVDKNPMAVELAKVALWLHTFTAGAPLSFLDHHLRCGDSLFGENVRGAINELRAASPLLLNSALQRAEGAIKGMEFVENLTDADIAEVKASSESFAQVETSTRALSAFLSFQQAIKWLQPLYPRTKDEARNCPLEHDELGAYSGLMAGSFGDPLDVVAGIAEPTIPVEQLNAEQQASMGRRTVALKSLIARAHALADEEHFLHWQVAFPGVWRNWQSAEPDGGFDAVIGNPPWDRMKMQEVEWFKARAPQVAKQARGADRKSAISALRQSKNPLAEEYDLASARAEKGMERARKSGDYPLLSKGDINLYSLFVERAQSLIKPSGFAGLLTPSGIMSDKLSEAFLKSVIPEGRVIAGIDFFNKRDDGSLFFPDVYYRYKFCVFICARHKHGDGVGRFGFFLRSANDVTDDTLIPIDAAKINEISPTSFVVPVLRNEAEFALAMQIADGSNSKRFRELGSLRYRRMFDMGTDSALFVTVAELNAKGAYPTESGLWRNSQATFERLFEGKMVQAYDHRAASVGFYRENTFRTGASETTTEELYADPMFLSVPRFFVDQSLARWHSTRQWALAIKDVTSTTNTRSTIAALIPRVGAGHTLPLLFERDGSTTALSAFTCANLNAFVLDFFARQKIHNNHLTLNIIEQLPLIISSANARAFGKRSAADIVRDHVLRLTYTAHDMTPFARDMGHDGPPFRWDEAERRQLRARLDALYFHLYGITNEADIRYILSTFPIVERKDRAEHDGVYLTTELIIWHFRALAAGDSQTDAPEALLIRNAKRPA